MKDWGGALEKLADRTRGTRAAPALRAAREVVDRACGACGRPPLKVELEHFHLWGYLRHRSFLHQVATGSYEPLLRSLLEEFLRPGAAVIDGGAHIGLYTLLAGHRVGSAGHVIAFEPDPYNLRALEFNVRSAALANVRVIAAALSDELGTSPFHVSSGTIGSSIAKKTYIDDYRSTLEVRTSTIDHHLGDLPLPALLVKLDVEGAEPLAIRGAQRALQRCSDGRVILEHNPSALRDDGAAMAGALRLLRSLGFSVQAIDEGASRLHPLGESPPPSKCNLVADKRA
jgi:FkbM family methyltransferase